MERTTKIISVKGMAMEVEPIEGMDGHLAVYSKRNGIAVEFNIVTQKSNGQGSRKHAAVILACAQKAMKLWSRDEDQNRQ